ncbi:MAG: hypothetical protein ACYC5H_04620 [Methylovirgula sp.]
MHRTAILGACFLIAAPLVPIEAPAFFDRLTLKAELHDLAGGIRGLSATHISVDPSRHTVLIEGLLLRRPDLTLRIGRLAMHLAPPRSSFAATNFMQAAAATDLRTKPASNDTSGALARTGTIAADNISIETGAFHATIKHIDMAGTQLSKADLAALFDPQATGSAAERLAKISAAHVAISEIVIKSKQITQAAPADAAAPKLDNKLDGPSNGKADAKTPTKIATNTWDEKIVLQDIAMDDVVQGRAKLATIGATNAVIREADAGELQAAFGPARLTGLDLTQAARLLPGAVGTGKHQSLCDSLSVNGVKISAPKAEFGFATLALKDVQAGSMPSPAKAGRQETDDAKETAVAQLLAKVDIGSLGFTDLRFTTSSGATPWAGGISHGVVTEMEGNKIGEANFEDFAIAGDGAKVKIGRLTWHGVDSAPANAKSTAAEPVTNAPQDQQKITADSVDLDVANPGSDQTPAANPAHFQLSHLELTSSDPIDGVPTRIKADFDHFTFDVGAMKKGYLAPLAALGYGKLDLSSRFKAHLNSDNSELSVETLSLSGADMGSVQVSGRLDHVTKALFSTDQADMEGGLLNLLLHRIEIRVDNSGLFERVVAAVAKKNDTTPVAIRQEFAAAVTAGIPEWLDHGRGADVIAAALAKFIAQPKTFHLSVTAPDGIGALDVALIRDPATLLQKVEVEAAADQ